MPTSHPLMSIIVAMTPERIIGRAGQLPWFLPEDLQLFREWTLGGTLIMGRRTYQSLPRPLDGRHNLVLSNTLAPTSGITVCQSWIEAMKIARQLGKNIWVIGGAEIYRIALEDAEQLVISWVEGEFTGDTSFPTLWHLDWELVSQIRHQGFTQCRYRRLKQSGGLATKQAAGLLTAPFAE